MSHFTVMVITPADSNTSLDAQLQPFHQYECTGIEDQYVVWVDSTEEVTAEWEAKTDEQKAEYGNDLAQFVEDWYGCDVKVVDGKVTFGRMTNPNYQWDWWQLGGRWSGFLKLKPGAKGSYGKRSWTNKDKADDMDRADQARKGDIDVEGMRDEQGQRAGARWDKMQQAIIAAGLTADTRWQTWEHIRDTVCNGDVAKARDTYHAQPALAAVKKAFDNPFFDADNLLCTREQYVQQARDEAIMTFAFLKDGQWAERGDWARQFNEMFDALPDDTLISIVDCHI